MDIDELTLSKKAFLEENVDFFDIEDAMIVDGEITPTSVGYTGMVEVPFSIPSETTIKKFNGLLITLPKEFNVVNITEIEKKQEDYLALKVINDKLSID